MPNHIELIGGPLDGTILPPTRTRVLRLELIHNQRDRAIAYGGITTYAQSELNPNHYVHVWTDTPLTESMDETNTDTSTIEEN